MGKHDANADRFTRNVDRAIASGKAAAAAERDRQSRTSRVESERAR